jgi:anaerobic selenocysteine-containing dehydrogenase
MSFGSGTRVGKVTDLEYLRKRISVEMNMEDAMRLHLRRGDIVKITSETTFEASVMPSQRIKKGMLRVAEGALRKGGTARDLPARIDAGV